MGSSKRSVLYRTLKDYGWQPVQRFPEYTTDTLKEIARELGLDPEEILSSAEQEPATGSAQPPEEEGLAITGGDEVLRVDERGRQWYQEEVRKPAYPKPRGRRVLTYVDPGVEQQTVKDGQYIETFEVAGNRSGRTSEVKITLPSFQVGIYKDPRFPFKVHCYNGREGFDLFEVEAYWGGAQLVPATVKRTYIENQLCYDMRSVIQTIQTEYRQLQLQKGNR